jgi:hypothetical protein
VHLNKTGTITFTLFLPVSLPELTVCRARHTMDD